MMAKEGSKYKESRSLVNLCLKMRQQSITTWGGGAFYKRPMSCGMNFMVPK